MHIDAQGQITIPIEILAQLGLEPGTEVEFEINNDYSLLIRPVRPVKPKSDLIESLRGKSTAKLSTDQIMRLTRENQD